MFASNLWTCWWLFVVWTSVSASPLPHLQKAFKCAGDHGKVCDTGLCYDALGFYESGQNVGCAPQEMCRQVGCFMYKQVFTCCCANRFCNGKTEVLMLAKFEMFKRNHGSWPTNLPPRVFARNITIQQSAHKPNDSRIDVRLAPARKSAAVVELTPTTQSATVDWLPAVTINSQAMSSEMPEEQLRDESTSRSQAIERQSLLQKSQLSMFTSTSTTTEIADLSASDVQKQPLIIEKKVKLSSNLDSANAIHDIERTTRSSQASSTPHVTTDQPLKQKEKLRDVVRVGKIKATTHQPQRPQEMQVVRSYPWYVVTIVGFIIASIIGVIIYRIFRKHFQRGSARRGSHDEKASSVDSSRISADAAYYHASDTGEHQAAVSHPLLTSEEKR